MREREREADGEIVVMDVCPACGGIWLDKGELEKLTRLEARSSGSLPAASGDDDDEHGGGGGHGSRRRGRGGFLGNLFGGLGDD